MSPDVSATLLTGVGILVGVWRMVESVRRDVDGVRRDVDGVRRDVDGVRRDVDGVRRDVDGVRRDVTAQIAAVNTRIDNILLSDRGGKST